jgi:hypothetical protein
VTTRSGMRSPASWPRRFSTREKSHREPQPEGSTAADDARTERAPRYNELGEVRRNSVPRIEKLETRRAADATEDLSCDSAEAHNEGIP